MQRSGVDSAADDQRRSYGLVGSSIWIGLCLLMLLWWASGYRSLVEWLAEWQFNLLDRYYPSLTVTIIVLLFGLPIAAIVGGMRRLRRRRLDAAAGFVDARVFVERAAVSAARGAAFFMGTAILAAVVAVGVFASMLWLPSDNGPVRTIHGVATAVQPEGPATYARPFRLGRVSRIVENVGLARRVMYIAPVYLLGQRHSASLLTMVDPMPAHPDRAVALPAGVLVERGLPRELMVLYQGVGIDVPDRSYLLMRDGATVRWRPMVLAIQTALLSLALFFVALLFRRQVRQLGRVVKRRSGSTTV